MNHIAGNQFSPQSHHQPIYRLQNTVYCLPSTFTSYVPLESDFNQHGGWEPISYRTNRFKESLDPFFVRLENDIQIHRGVGDFGFVGLAHLFFLVFVAVFRFQSRHIAPSSCHGTVYAMLSYSTLPALPLISLL
ncbi:hypothetical protein HRR83_006680 [Exophiala dermatitidis]|uniref:Uncharacterized protein n=1 Tax=Exophiala dermatitidis TaxID=5970 RepID=A0AAN6ITP2_EXODE|nr:hypothetical protein HRR74_005840 [Exophiala dermatitidis]KAJ4515335.1 hypothetical protein HRR73_005166 [Exophiala dermatitidis]KAJ4533830.1 hypothetical protein HRR77_008314 [Exophiala dermatitidis]KAJ4540861.1 hypothetical protein HRR76_004245 [Exophiala dermatitidis]KAJ4560494.1 hypothetical protein HRR79_007902 [Exophiala dermatitidis]